MSEILHTNQNFMANPFLKMLIFVSCANFWTDNSNANWANLFPSIDKTHKHNAMILVLL